ncbi:flagellar export protein FliJ [Undibacterium sp. RuRC25W]|uniref:flagellar export protein FliJ n=1 Tax=Undibacterium sp. RuRC25W TaxID=3413047 RepID=UPI003BF15A77
MATQSAIATLIEIAEKDTDEAAKKLGKAIRYHEETIAKLNLLAQYRDDYDMKFRDNAARGISASQYANFTSFLDKLDSAVEGQKLVVAEAARRIEIAKNNWQGCEKKRLSYNTLDQRTKIGQQLKETKRDQKQTDDFAARAYFYKS